MKIKVETFSETFDFAPSFRTMFNENEISILIKVLESHIRRCNAMKRRAPLLSNAKTKWRNEARHTQVILNKILEEAT